MNDLRSLAGRSEAFYTVAADPQHSGNPQVIATQKAGLRNCRVFSKKTPNDVLQFLGSLEHGCDRLRDCVAV